MDDGEIRDFLSSQQMGVLGLPGDEVPYLIPISYGTTATSGSTSRTSSDPAVERKR